MDPNFGFNSPAMDTNSKPAFSSARLLRRKKPTPSSRSRQNSSTNDHDFNPFRKAPYTGMGHGPAPGRVDTGPFGLSTDTFGPGVSGRSGSGVSSINLEDFMEKVEISDGLRELKIENNRAKLSKNINEFDKFQFLEMRDELKQMNIGGAVDFRTVLKRELENLNIGDDAKVFSETVISDYLKGLKIKETMPSNSTAGENERRDANLKEIREEAKGVEKGSGKSEESLHPFSSGITSRDGLEGDRQEDQTTRTSFMSNGIPFNGKAFEAPLRDGVEEIVRVGFTSKPDYGGIENLQFGALNLDGGLNGMTEQKRETAKGSRYRKKKGKVRKDIPTQPSSAVDSVCVENSQQNDEFVESYSPMDVSPYRDTLTDEVLSQQAPVVLDQKIMHDHRDFSMEPQFEASSDVGEEECDMMLPRVISEVEVLRHTKEAEPSYSYGKEVDAQCSSDESVSDAETESFKSATDQFEYSSDSFATAADAGASDTEVTSSSISKAYDDDSNFDSSWAENGDSSFRVAPSAAGQSQSLEKPSGRSKKRNQVNVTYDFSSYTPSDKDPSAVSVTRTQLSPERGVKSDASFRLNQWKTKAEDISCTAASHAAQELCEKWRLRGNQAYAIGNLSDAENFYTEGVNTISESETSRSCLRALALCYSNRAASRLSLGRIKDALEDCMKAISIDPNFPRVHIRAANCYLALGEIENALLHFERGSHAGPGISVEKKLLAEASEGLQKAKKASEIFKLSAELLHRRKHADAERALLLIDEALMISPCSEKLLERKADALLMMQKYEDVIQLCGLNLIANSESSGSDDQQRASLTISQRSLLIAKAYFFLGRLENALDILKKQELLLVSDKCGSMMMESFNSLAGTISELLRLKDAGNRAFQSGKHDEAVQHYTAAISWNVLSRPFTAICYCNRAAAYQAMGQVTDALADCSLGIALDPNYLKPYSRRAALFEVIRDYRQAALDLQRLLSLLKKKLEDTSSDRMSYINELKQVDLKLSLMEEAARNEVALDLYLVLGVDRSAAASEIKKAYRRAALKFHPDKAGQSLARNEGADDTIWREIASRVYTDADRLFKMIGEAYAILSEPSKRAQYDMEEEIRNAYANRGSGNSIYAKQEDFKRYPYGRRKWEEGRPYGRYPSGAGNGSSRAYWYA